MHDHLLSWVLAVVTGVVVALATRVQLLPDVIDLSVIPTGAGLGSLLGCAVGAALRFEPDRLGRVALLGTLFGGGITSGLLLLGLIL